MHQCLKFILFGVTLYMFRTVFPSIIRSSRLYIHQQAYVQSWTPDDGRKDRPKHVECYSKQNKFEALVHLFGFIIVMYYDARSYERQKYFMRTGNETDA